MGIPKRRIGWSSGGGGGAKSPGRFSYFLPGADHGCEGDVLSPAGSLN
jgi:hypothetical protein